MLDFYQIWFFGSLATVSAFTYYLLHYYSHKSNHSWTVKLLTYTGWFLGLATIAILPLDISLANETRSDQVESLEFQLRIFWRCFYWAAFIFSFLLVPFAMNFEVSGEFDPQLRLREAAVKLIQKYVLYAGLGVLFLTFLWIRGTFSIDGGFTVRGFLMAMGSAFGLLQIIVFLGYGLVNVPKQLYFSNSLAKRGNLALVRVDSCEDRLQQTQLSVEDLY